MAATAIGQVVYGTSNFWEHQRVWSPTFQTVYDKKLNDYNNNNKKTASAHTFERHRTRNSLEFSFHVGYLSGGAFSFSSA